MLKEPELRLCPYFLVEFPAQRNNQRFSTPQARQKWHNNQNNFLRKKLSSINKELLRSWKVADALLGDNVEAVVNKYFMRGRGFSFQNFTHVVAQKNEIVYGLYDITFEKLNEEEYLIKRKK
jgi:hypothetical protein